MVLLLEIKGLDVPVHVEALKIAKGSIAVKKMAPSTAWFLVLEELRCRWVDFKILQLHVQIQKNPAAPFKKNQAAQPRD